MIHDPKRHRRSIRLKGYDYTQPGAYFVTIVIQDRLCLFGDVVGETMLLNEAGAMIKDVWEGLPRRFPSVDVDAFVVMPNHVHGIVVINQPVVDGRVDGDTRSVVGASLVGAQVDGDTRATTRVAPTDGAGDDARAAARVAPEGDRTDSDERAVVGAPLVGAQVDGDMGATTRVAPTIGDIVGAYKSITTVEYARGVKARRWQRFHMRLWQRNYYEHIIRDANELDRAREYIVNNPLKWALDRENPANAVNPASPS